MDAGIVKLQVCTQEGHSCSDVVIMLDKLSMAEFKSTRKLSFMEDTCRATASDVDDKRAKKRSRT